MAKRLQLIRFAAVGCVAILVAGSFAHGQAPEPGYIAFRVDDQRVIANVLVRPASPPQIRKGLSPAPLARYGYQHFELPESWRDRPTDIRPGDRWLVHMSPGKLVEATVDRVVGGYVGCEAAFGALLRVAPTGLKEFAASRARYFVAAPAAIDNASTAATRSSESTSPPLLTPDMRRSLESTLNQLMARELPKVRLDAAPFLTRELTHPYRDVRAWARERLQIEDAMERGRGLLKYDMQAFRLSPDGAPVYFVRAEWLVGTRQGFAASLWLRMTDGVEVLETNVRPASWMRMSLYQQGVGPPHLGLILNTTDRDDDGWGEVLLAQEGYESRSITLLEYSPAGFQPTGVQMTGGC